MKINLRASSLHVAVVGLLNAVLQVVNAFGVKLSDGQNVAITALVNAVLVIVSLVLVTATNGKPA